MKKSIIPRRDNLSSYFEKIDPETRDQVDAALVNRTPPTFTACYKQFKLEEKGLSFSAFYRYARRVRTHATMHRLAQLTAPTEADVDRHLPLVISREIIDTLIADGHAPSRVIHRLADAYRIASQVAIDRRKSMFSSHAEHCLKDALNGKIAGVN